jgi:hypothetical protein
VQQVGKIDDYIEKFEKAKARSAYAGYCKV